MRYFILTLAAVGLLSAPALANHAEGHVDLHNITVKVNGLVCDFCARALEKVFYKQDGVQSVDVNLAEHYVTLGLDDTAHLSDEEITQHITDAGYSVVEIIHPESH